MANDPAFIDYVCDQAGAENEISCRNMFGGTTLYARGKVVALICDNQLFVKPTTAGRDYIGNVTEAPAYKGSKNFFLVNEQLDDAEWLAGLIAVTEQELPKPKPKRKKSSRKKRA